jgi:uncharacterized protein YutE (UPF0331/DUF86 family)
LVVDILGLSLVAVYSSWDIQCLFSNAEILHPGWKERKYDSYKNILFGKNGPLSPGFKDFFIEIARFRKWILHSI